MSPIPIWRTWVWQASAFPVIGIGISIGVPQRFFDLNNCRSEYLKWYAPCRRPLLASRDCHLGALVPPFWHPRSYFGISGLLGWSFWHLGSTLGGYFGTSGTPCEAILALRNHPGGPWEQQDGFGMVNTSSRIWVDFGMISGLVYVSLNSSKILCVLSLFPEDFVIDFWLEVSTFGTSKSWFRNERYCSGNRG